MDRGYTIINIDESTLSSTDPRTHGWQVIGKHNQYIEKTELIWTNIIAAISNKGEFFYTINRGKVNANTFKWFMLKLVRHLNRVNQDWR